MYNTKDSLKQLNSSDTYSLILFCLYKIKNNEKYSTLSELAYVLDKDNLLKLCEYFGGLTIKIPTIDEIESLVQALLLYQYVNIEGMDFNNAIKQIVDRSSHDVKKIKTIYTDLVALLNEYQFKSREL